MHDLYNQPLRKTDLMQYITELRLVAASNLRVWRFIILNFVQGIRMDLDKHAMFF